MKLATLVFSNLSILSVNCGKLIAKQSIKHV